MKFMSLLLLSAALSLTACSPTAPSAEQMTKLLEDHPEVLVKAIEKNPDVFMGAVQKAAQAAQGKMQANQQQVEAAKLDQEFKNPLKPEVDSKRAVMGNADAPITIVEYTDFQCPYCGRGYKTLEDVRKQYGDKVKVLVKNLPLPMHPMAIPAAKRFEALKLQSAEKGFAFYHEVFEHQQELGSVGEKFLDAAAKKVGGDVKRMQKDMESDSVKSIIAKDQAEAQSFDIQGTPGFIINGVSVRGAYPLQHFQQIIDRHLSASK